jgi:hexokinase
VDPFLSGIDITARSFSHYYLRVAKQNIFWMGSELKMQHIMGAGANASFAENVDRSC